MDIKQGIRRNFARRAATYDCHAEVQRFMALELLAQTEAAVRQAACILEVGCGTGYLTSELRRINPEAHLVGMDLDAALLARARRRLGPDSRVVWVVADGEAVPGKALDLIIFNSTFQWFIHPKPPCPLILIAWAREVGWLFPPWAHGLFDRPVTP